MSLESPSVIGAFTHKEITKYLPSPVKGLSYVEVLSGVSSISVCPYYFFLFLAFCGIVLMLWFMGVLAISKHFFHTGWCIRDCEPSGIYISLSFYINVTLFRLISLFMLIFFTYVCLGISDEDWETVWTTLLAVFSSPMLVMSFCSSYIRSYEAKCCYDLSNPINCQFWHHSCVWLKELPQDMVSHPYIIFRHK